MGGAPPRNIKVVEVFPPGGGRGTHTRTPYLVPFRLRPADAHSRGCVIWPLAFILGGGICAPPSPLNLFIPRKGGGAPPMYIILCIYIYKLGGPPTGIYRLWGGPLVGEGMCHLTLALHLGEDLCPPPVPHDLYIPRGVPPPYYIYIYISIVYNIYIICAHHQQLHSHYCHNHQRGTLDNSCWQHRNIWQQLLSAPLSTRKLLTTALDNTESGKRFDSIFVFPPLARCFCN